MTLPDPSAQPPESPLPGSSPPLPPLDPELAEEVHALGADAWWAIDIVPLLKPQASDPMGRFAVMLVMAHEVVVHTEFIRHPGGDHAIQLIVNTLRIAAHKSGVWPEQLLIRGEGLDLALQDALDDAGEFPNILVSGFTRFSHHTHPAGAAVDQAILDLRHHMDGAMIPDAPASSSPTWAAWGVALEHIETFFNVTADVYRAVAARRFAEDNEGVAATNSETGTKRKGMRAGGGALLIVEEPEMLDSMAVLFGDGDTLNTILLFTAREDWEAMVEAGASDPVSADVQYPVSCISLVPKEELWGGMADEVTAHGWPVAGPSAYPTLWILNAEGGGMTTDYCTLINSQLAAIGRAIMHGATGPLNPESVFRYEDAQTGLIVRTILDE
ncbi:MAG TPA: hypothetical protein VNU46_01530 [Gemmatimonadaceae bacterium]|jgi:hypothetical protein|nr:hypothetical protein [Gemmatimonadaceae bacterium]